MSPQLSLVAVTRMRLHTLARQALDNGRQGAGGRSGCTGIAGEAIDLGQMRKSHQSLHVQLLIPAWYKASVIPVEAEASKGRRGWICTCLRARRASARAGQQRPEARRRQASRPLQHYLASRMGVAQGAICWRYFLRLEIRRGPTVVRLYRLSVLPKNSSPNGRTILSNDYKLLRNFETL